MSHARRSRPPADVAVGYAADAHGFGIAYATISSGAASGVVRLPFRITPLPVLEGRDAGYAAVAVVTAHLKSRGVGRVRLRLADGKVVSELAGEAAPPKALTMPYVRTRCLLHGLGTVRLEMADAADVRDLTRRAVASLTLHSAA
ncbi:MAG: hypothetical protein ABR591_03350 [Candidatus Velthaea sp.]